MPRLTKGVKALGDYSPELDDPLIHQAARALIYVNKSEDYMDKAADAKVLNRDYAPPSRTTCLGGAHHPRTALGHQQIA